MRGQTNDPWPKRMLWVSTLLLALAVPLWWIMTGYFQRTPSQSISFNAVDGWCDHAPSQGIGVHCFGDFQLPRLLIDSPSVWNDPQQINVGYTPAGLTPNAAAKALEEAGLGIRGSLIAFLIAMALAMAVPAVLTALRGARVARGPLPLLLFFAAAAPVLIAFDRGNSVGFVIPFLLAFGVYLGRDPRWVAPFAVIGATAVRPQFILIAIALIAVRRTRDALAAVAGAIAFSIWAFVLWPGDRLQNIRDWWSDVTGFGSSVAPSEAVINLSAARSTFLVGDFLSGLPTFIGSLGEAIRDFALENPSMPGGLLVIACLCAFALRRGRIARPIVITVGLALPVIGPGVSFGYYLVFAVVLAALVCGPADPVGLRSRDDRGILADLTRRRGIHQAWAWTLVAAIGFSLAPLAFNTPATAYTTSLGWVGVVWLAVIVLPLAWGAIGLARAHLRRPSS